MVRELGKCQNERILAPSLKLNILNANSEDPKIRVGLRHLEPRSGDAGSPLAEPGEKWGPFQGQSPKTFWLAITEHFSEAARHLNGSRLI